MNLHRHTKEFEELIVLASQEFHLPLEAIRKDYYITLILQNLAQSEYVDQLVFKGGTSLSKCYPGSIERFSEDIDLTFIPAVDMSTRQIDKKLKLIETILIGEGAFEKIDRERNDRNKSSYVWFDGHRSSKIKLEIGSSVRPDPYGKKELISYIHEYLLKIGELDAIEEFQLVSVEVNVLNIERTFIDKLMAIKRHAICGNLGEKVRHIYDIVKLFETEEIKASLEKPEELKRIVMMTKQTDSFYLEKRNIPKEYDPLGPYNYSGWKQLLDDKIKENYEKLHEYLLYTNEKQEWKQVDLVLTKINQILISVGE